MHLRAEAGGVLCEGAVLPEQEANGPGGFSAPDDPDDLEKRALRPAHLREGIEVQQPH